MKSTAGRSSLRSYAGWVVVAAIFSASVALTHFLDVIMLALLLGPTVVWMGRRAQGAGLLGRFVLALTTVIIVAAIAAAPGFAHALRIYLWPRIRDVWVAIRTGWLFGRPLVVADAPLYATNVLAIYNAMWIALGISGAVAIWWERR